MRAQRVRASAVVGAAFFALVVGQAVPAAADAPADLMTQPCRTVGAPPDSELQHLAQWMATVTSGGPNPQVRVGAFDAVRSELGDQAGGVGLDNARGTFYVRFSPGPLDAAGVYATFVRAVERVVPAEYVDAIRPRLRVVAQTYPQAELLALQRSFFDRVRAEWPGLPISASVGCRESDDVRVEIEVYDLGGDEGEAAVRRMAAEYGDRIIVVRRQGGPPEPAVGSPSGPLGRPVAPVPPTTQTVRPLPRFTNAVVVRRRCGHRPAVRIALAPRWRSRLRGFRVGTGTWRRTAIVVPLRRAVRVEVAATDGRRIVGRITRCP